MGGEIRQLHIFFLPFMAHGHAIPMLDMVKLFASRGVKSTIITTTLNVPVFQKPIETFKKNNPAGFDIGIMSLDFPCKDLGLPEGCENLDFITSNPNAAEGNLLHKFFFSTRSLKEPLKRLIEKIKPDALVADMFFPWANEAAEKYGVPRLVFHGTSFFALCATECVRVYEPHKKLITSSSAAFVIPNLPGNIVMTAEQMSKHEENDEMGKFMEDVGQSTKKSYGVLVNSFYELESTYADFYRNFLERRSWHIGPVLLCNRGMEEKAERGKKANIDEDECLKWLDSKKVNSVIYLSFGSLSKFPDAQLMEIAVALERSGLNFIWVVRKDDMKGENEDWLPEGFEERMRGRGLIIRGWAPQVLILDHQAIGGFVTHCGWNSVVEGISAGVPMVTWPIAAEQFYNEKLVTEVLKVGVSVGVRKWVRTVGDFINRDKVEKAVREVMVGEKAEERRSRAEGLAEMAKAAVEKGGSSYDDLNRFMEEMELVRSTRVKEEGA